jgi:hypothetical protein
VCGRDGASATILNPTSSRSSMHRQIDFEPIADKLPRLPLRTRANLVQKPNDDLPETFAAMGFVDRIRILR